MKLRAVTVENCRSIEHAALEDLKQVNVLVGHNNAGKSSFFHALECLPDRLNGRSTEWTRTLRNGDVTRPIRIETRFTLTDEERREFFRTVPIADGDQAIEAHLATPAAGEARFSFGMPVGEPGFWHLYRTQIHSSEGEWATIQEIDGSDRQTNPVTRLSSLDKLLVSGSFTKQTVALGHGVAEERVMLPIHEWRSVVRTRKDTFFQRLWVEFFFNAFFLGATRGSADQLQADAAGPLQRNGANLPQALLAVHTGNRNQFRFIEEFIRDALPDVGELHTPLARTQTRVAFRLPNIPDPIPLVDMGTGVQHMIMVGLILATTHQDTPIFFEEPEANLHLGSQRYLLDRLSRDGRQVFLTSHSPVFAAPAVDAAVYRIYNTENRTRVAKVVDAADRSAALQSIGARNSDVLLSDVVIFVEGTSDRAILTTWAAVLGKGFNAHNVTVLLVGSTEAVRLVSRPRKEVLEGLSRGLPVAHRFLFDRDERTESELDELRVLLGDALEVLSVREIENHLLLPRPLVVHIRNRLKASGRPVPEKLTEVVVADLISKFAKSLQPVVMLKRIRAGLPKFEGGPFPRALANELTEHSTDPKLGARIRRRMREHYGAWIGAVDLTAIVKHARVRMKQDEKDPRSILRDAPGADVLEKLFGEFCLRYDKEFDGAAIAGAMNADEIPEEIRRLVDWASTV